jgi:hypothetical protein
MVTVADSAVLLRALHITGSPTQESDYEACESDWSVVTRGSLLNVTRVVAAIHRRSLEKVQDRQVADGQFWNSSFSLNTLGRMNCIDADWTRIYEARISCCRPVRT